MLDRALEALLAAGGVNGIFLVLFLLCIIYLQSKRDTESAGRLSDARELLTTAADVNRALTVLRDSVGGVAQSQTTLTTTIQTMHADSAAYREASRERDRRVEEMIGESAKLVRSIQETVKDAAELTVRNNKILKDLHDRGTE
jgi:methyl-accepting chemotaxis protein